MSYWDKRISRRMALKTSAAAGLGVATLSLIGCGSGGSKSGTSSTKGTLMSIPQDTTAKAKSGGTFRYVDSSEVPSLDPTSASGGINAPGYSYPRLVKFKTAKYPSLATGEVEGDLAESWEMSPDKMQITFHLRQGMKWDPRSPTNGREIDAQDVTYSFDRFSKLSTYAASVVWSQASPANAVVSLTATDAHTIVAKLDHPDPSAMPSLAWTKVTMIPREADGGFNAKGDIRGYGPWRLDSLSPSGYTWVKNPDYYVKGRPFIDKIEQPVITDYASRMAQFRAGNIYTGVVNPPDIIQTKKDIPELVLQAGTTYEAGYFCGVTFGWEGNSPFKDVRIRQAVNYLIDRDAYLDALTDKDKFAAEGIDLPAKLTNFAPPAWGSAWADPRDEKFSPSTTKYFKHDIAAAKQLLSAGGLANGFNTAFVWALGHYGYPYEKMADLLIPMWAEAGIKAENQAVNYDNVFVPNIHRGYVQGHIPSGQGTTSIRLSDPAGKITLDTTIYAAFHPGGASYIGMSPDGNNPSKGDPEVTSLIEKIRSEFDIQRQVALAQELEKLMPAKAYLLPTLWSVPAFNLSWPALKNVGADSTWTAGIAQSESWINYWIDETQAPLKKKA